MNYEVSQETANEILYEAYEAFKLYSFFSDDFIDDSMAPIYRERARALYQVWSMITNIEFENGWNDLANFIDDDFADVIAKQEYEDRL